MSFQLYVVSGPLLGTTFLLKHGDIIGRTGVNITIEDPKMSAKHARVDRRADGSWTITDLGSTNGIRYKDKLTQQVVLAPGVSLVIGNTRFSIVATKVATPPPLPKSGSKKPVLPVEEPAPPVKDWSHYFVSFSERSLSKVKNSLRELAPFSPLVVLTFTHGPQAGSVWVLGYGPRAVGLGSLDLPLFENGLPPIAFELFPREHHACFTTQHPENVLLNGRTISSEVLKPGDEIQLENTRIKVSFKE